MKKTMFLFALICCISVGGFAQKANVKKAYSKANATVDPDFDAAIELINEALHDETTKNDAKTWYTAGLVYDRQQEAELAKLSIGTSSDDFLIGESAMKAYTYYLKAYELDQLPNEKGKISPKYDKEIKEALCKFYNQMSLLNYGAKLYQEEDYKTAIKAFECHLSIPNLSLLENEKNRPQKDSVYYQASYWTAQVYYVSGDKENSARKFESIKDKGYEENQIHQFLYSIYLDNKDTVNYVRILKEGADRFPSEFFYLGTLINYYSQTGNIEQASDYLDQIIAKDNTNPVYYNAKGLMMQQLDRFDEAIACYDKALEIDPENVAALINRGIVVHTQAANLDKSALNIRNNRVLEEQIKAQAQEKYKESLKYFEKVYLIDSKNLENLKMLRALYFRFMGDKKYEGKYEEIDAIIKSL
ncbi:MAG: tetratricopeptide repeat protein [Prevotellaceae bacterium]|jgi:tetratricopeptide (TPR) repeat protein|nr:tetratricopeptide repeat protein [Prevotellaceae bacterium]